MNMRILTLFFLLFNLNLLFGQNNPSTTLKGKIVDAKNSEPLPGVNVFIPNSFIGTTTDSEGYFEIKYPPKNSFKLVASIVGYEKEFKNITALNKEIKIKLSPKVYKLGTVNVVTDKSDWQMCYSIFRNEFIGHRRYGSDCTIKNPYSIDFHIDPETNIMTASCDSIITLENYGLGYKISFLLDYFKWDLKVRRNKSRCKFYALFDTLEAEDQDQVEDWEENRKEAYYSSPRYFFYQFINKNVDIDKFLYLKKGGLPPSKQTLQFTDPMLPNPGFFEFEPDEIKIDYDPLGNFYVLYPNYEMLVIRFRPGEDEESKVEFLYDEILFEPSGKLVNPDDVNYKLHWAKFRVSDMLPNEYYPPSDEE